MNNKGMTLVEVIVSLILIVIVMIFIFSILIDLKNEDYLSNSKSEDAIKRTEIIHLIENDFINYHLKEITNSNSCQNNAKFCLGFKFYDISDKNLLFFDDHLVYDNEVWYISLGKFETEKLTWCYTETLPLYRYFSITIPITHDAAVKRKTTIDLSYISTKEDVKFSMPTYLRLSNGTQINKSC